MRLFVYGTLLSGQRSHRRLADAVSLGTARTLPIYTLVDLGAYPAMVDGGSTAVAGELYEVDAETLASIDAFEGHPVLYRRTDIGLEGGARAQAYLLEDRLRARRSPVVAGGDWRGRPGAGRARGDDEEC